MTILAMMLPLARISPLHTPRRDIVLAGGDGLRLQLTIIERDAPDAPVLNLSAIGPRVRLLVGRSAGSGVGWWDYGWVRDSGALLATATGVVVDGVAGRVDLVLPRLVAECPRRLWWLVQLDYLDDIATIAGGIINVGPAASGVASWPETALDLLTDDYVPIETDDEIHIEV